MPGRNTNHEVEIRLRLTDVSALRRRLKTLLSREISPRTHEFNTLYDTASRNLTRRGQLVRIRIERPMPNAGKGRRYAGGSAILTYKGPSQSKRDVRAASRKSGKKEHYKVREEFEVAVGDPEHMSHILLRLGLRPAFHYEKFRTTYAVPGIRNLKIELDETPVGLYLELEGPVSAIDRAAIVLGYARSDYITRTYGAIYVAACRRSGHKPGHMLFKATKKLR